ncbi:hypothetical protein R3I94_010797 [Phoxinus phoxinus]
MDISLCGYLEICSTVWDNCICSLGRSFLFGHQSNLRQVPVEFQSHPSQVLVCPATALSHAVSQPLS